MVLYVVKAKVIPFELWRAVVGMNYMKELHFKTLDICPGQHFVKVIFHL
jgi:hypothetical protein